MLSLWRAYRGSGMGGGHLPFTGGAAEQPALLMDCFAWLDHVADALKPKDKD